MMTHRARTISCGFVDESSLLASKQTCTHPPMPDGAFHNLFFWSFPKYSSSHLQPALLTCIVSHDCVSFSQLDRNSATDLALSLHATSDADLWMQRSLLASMRTCTTPAMPGTACHNHNILIFFKVQLITSAPRCTDLHRVP